MSLIANATFIVTNSFHGTCYSINFNVNFLAVPRGKYNGRITNLLETVQLSNRYVGKVEELINIDVTKSIDFELVNNIIEEKRQEGFAWLRRVVQEEIIDEKNR